MPLAFTREFDAKPGEAVGIAPGVRRVTARNPGPFTFTGTNSFLIGDSELAILDPGPLDPVHTDSILAAAAGAPIVCILISHSHSDHSAGAEPLKEATGASVFAARRAQVSTFAGTEAPATDSAGVTGFAPDAEIGDGAILTIGSVELEVIASPGHASDHLAFALLGRDLIFSGDHVMGWSTTVVAPPDGSMSDYMSSLDRLLARPERTYLPAHGDAIQDGPGYVRALKQHRRMRERSILQALAEGDQKIPDLVDRLYPGLSPDLRGAAAMSTFAHLLDLAARRFVRADGLLDMSGVYGLTEVGPGAPE